MFRKSLNDQAAFLYTKWSKTTGQKKWKVYNWLCWLFIGMWFVATAPFVLMGFGPHWMTKFVHGEHNTSQLLVYSHWMFNSDTATNLFVASVISIILVKAALWLQDVTHCLSRGLKFHGSKAFGRGMINVSYWA